MSELLDVRVIGTPEIAIQAVDRLAELLDLDRNDGPYPSRKTPELVRYYLTGRLQPANPAPPVGAGEWLCDALVHIRAAIATALENETADRQYALEQTDSSLAALIERWRAGIGHPTGLTPSGGERP